MQSGSGLVSDRPPKAGIARLRCGRGAGARSEYWGRECCRIGSGAASSRCRHHRRGGHRPRRAHCPIRRCRSQATPRLCRAQRQISAASRQKPIRAAGRRSRMPADDASGNPLFSAVVVDVKGGKVLYADSADGLRHPASITKVMTLYMLFEQLDTGRLSLRRRCRSPRMRPRRRQPSSASSRARRSRSRTRSRDRHPLGQ